MSSHNKCDYCNNTYDDCECETEESVAAGLGLLIDDDGNWLPID